MRQVPADHQRLPCGDGRGAIVYLKLELVLVPVADVDRAKAFYTDRLGFALDVDTSPMEGSGSSR
jgi:predicted enzyme related to lactoylglutathione lyase